MNRRSLIKSLAGFIALVAALPKGASASRRNMSTPDVHDCNAFCFDAAEMLARRNIQETGDWKLKLHDWSNRTMVVTRCGAAACEVSREGAIWKYSRRSLTPKEASEFRAEYGRSHWLLMSQGASGGKSIRGFILNGRHDGWNLSIGPPV